MKTVLAFVLCFIFSLTAFCQQFAEVNKTFTQKIIYSAGFNYEFTDPPQAVNEDDNDSTPTCKGNGIVTFVNSSSQALWFYYWYVEDVLDPSNECSFRRFWKQLDAGSNQFTIAKDKTLIFRICSGAECSDSFIKQYGIVYYCNVKNGVIIVK